MKESLLESFSKRLSSISIASLNLANSITYAISLLTYTFRLIKWSNTDLEDTNRMIPTELTKHRMRHSSSGIKRIVLQQTACTSLQ